MNYKFGLHLNFRKSIYFLEPENRFSGKDISFKTDIHSDLNKGVFLY